MELTWNAFVDTALAHYRVNGWKGFYSFYSHVINGVEQNTIDTLGFGALDICHFYSDVENANIRDWDVEEQISAWRDQYICQH